MVEINKAAPEFTLPDEDSRDIKLSEYRDRWVVLYFYPRDNTPGCTTEAIEFSSLSGEFEKKNAVVFGISPDTCASHGKFKLKHNLSVKLLADPKKQVLKKYGAWGKKNMYGKTVEGVSRSTVLVNPRGEIVFHWQKVKAAGHAAAVLEKLAEIKNTQEKAVGD